MISFDLVSCEVAITGTSGTTFLRACQVICNNISPPWMYLPYVLRYRRVLLQALCAKVLPRICILYFSEHAGLSSSAALYLGASPPMVNLSQKGRENFSFFFIILYSTRFQAAHDCFVINKIEKGFFTGKNAWSLTQPFPVTSSFEWIFECRLQKPWHDLCQLILSRESVQRKWNVYL